MVTFTSKTANKEELKRAIWEELIKCTMNAVGPLYGDYERTRFDYSECKSGTDKRRKFAISFLEEWTETNLEVSDDGVVLNDNLHTEGTCNDDGYDLKALANAIKNKFPDVIIQGKGMIDYHHMAWKYRIYTENDTIVCECADDEIEAEDCDGLKFAVTGKIKFFENRAEIVEFIEEAGGSVTETVSKNTDYLICNDVKSNSSKMKKAKDLGIAVLSEADFIRRFADPDDFDDLMAE